MKDPLAPEIDKTLNRIRDEQFVTDFKRQQEINYQINKEHGFEEQAERAIGTEYEMDNVGLKIALIFTELSEALESFRHGDPPSDHIPEFTGSEEEFADAIIRIMCIAHGRGLRVAEALIAKRAFNAARPFRHGGKRF